jgi:uncharacterized protein YbaR (Trm112 family)
MEETLLQLLCAPGCRASLRLAGPQELAEINNRIQLRLIRNRDGLKLDSKLDGSLICESERCCFPIRDGLPFLIAGEAFEWPNNP